MTAASRGGTGAAGLRAVPGPLRVTGAGGQPAFGGAPAVLPALAPPAPVPDGTPQPGRRGRPVRLSLLGPLRVTAGGQEVSGGLRKARELLAFLAVHPDGAAGEAVSEALWPGDGPDGAAARRNLALRKARAMLRAATGLTGPMWITLASGRYRLDPALVSTDLQEFNRALDEARHADGPARLAACRRAVALYRGELAGGAYEWAGPYAEAARRRALDAWTAIAEAVGPRDPEAALAALEAALVHDPYNEYLYQKIMRLQAAAGRPEAARRTLALLESRLADLAVTPGARTRQVTFALLGTARPPGGPAGRRGRRR